jgi:hypothetical protein
VLGRSRKPVVRRCWDSSAVDLPGIPAAQVWDLVAPATRPLRVTRCEPPYVAEGFASRQDPANGAVFEISTPLGGSRLTTHIWRDLPEVWADDAWVVDKMQDFLDRVRAGFGVRADARLPPDLLPVKAGPGVSTGPVDRQRVSDRALLSGVTPQQVWDLIRPVEAAFYDPAVLETYVEPGTGPGVGEIQVCVAERGGVRTVTRNRVVHEDPPFLALTEVVDQEWPSGLTYRLSAQDGGTLLQMTGVRDHEPDRYVPDFLVDHRAFVSRFSQWINTTLQA